MKHINMNLFYNTPSYPVCPTVLSLLSIPPSVVALVVNYYWVKCSSANECMMWVVRVVVGILYNGMFACVYESHTHTHTGDFLRTNEASSRIVIRSALAILHSSTINTSSEPVTHCCQT
jgi:hypothetical protein